MKISLFEKMKLLMKETAMFNNKPITTSKEYKQVILILEKSIELRKINNENINERIPYIDKINEEWKEFICHNRWWSSINTIEDIILNSNEYCLTLNTDLILNIEIRDFLLSIDGSEVCLQTTIDESMLRFQFYKQIWFNNGTNINLEKMEECQCHSNSLKIWRTNYNIYGEDSLYYLCTGYALSEDGIWRRHSWLIDKSNKHIIETTREREIYCGYAMTHEMTKILEKHF